MIPFLYVPISRMPIDRIRGKIDRGALRQLGESITTDQGHALRLKDDDRETERSAADKEQLTETEARIAKLWVDVLRYPGRVLRDDCFFQLGGDSIMAFKLSAAAHRGNIALDTFTIIRHSVLRDMASKVETISAVEQCSEVPLDVEPFSLVGGRSDPATRELIERAADVTGVASDTIEDIYPLG
jgi:hypothetical protein